MAKSALDAGWSMLKTQLKYKVIARSGGTVVNDSYSTQGFSCSPRTAHDRDVNTEKNILAAGHVVPSVERGTVRRRPIEAEIHAFQDVEKKYKRIVITFQIVSILII